MVLLNFSKTFDVVSPVLLLQKLCGIDIYASLLNWIWDFVSIRAMCVC